MRRSSRPVLAITAAVLGGALAASSSAAARYPVSWNVLTALATGVLQPGTPPAGSNLSACSLSAHPYPVVLVHGTIENQNDNWQAVAPTLANDGYCVYSFTYGQTWYSGGIGAIGDIHASAKQLGSFVQHVLSKTGAKQVDIVGHSQGGMLPRLYMKEDGGVAFVHRLVGISSSNNRANVSGLSTILNLVPGAELVLSLGCPACTQQTTQPLYDYLNSGEVTYPSVVYTVIQSTHDEVVGPPYTQAFLPSAPNVTNETVQQVCPNDPVGHIGLPYDPDAVRMVLNALNPAHAQPVSCSTGFGL
jgi:triacylglycerol lipase